tara:strand:- start:1757 stop:3736 length:1980 start_codon:yes stop_codon:yes gene_type:complete
MKFLKILFISTIFVYLQAEPVNTGHAEVSLIKYNYSDSSKKNNLIGIKMDMQKNWHTYWKNPGDSGGPIKLKWETDKDIEIKEIRWPRPELIPYEPLMTYGYKDFVIFPFEYIKKGDQNSKIKLSVDFLICDDICVPEKAFIETSFNELLIDNNLKKWNDLVPTITLPVLAEVNNNFIELRFSYNDQINSAIFFINDQDIVNYPGRQILIKEENNWLLKIPTIENQANLNSINGVLSINDSEVFLIDGQIEKITTKSLSFDFLQAIIFAFLGGLILNLMPCVFPIISLKILSFVSLGNESNSKIRLHALSFCIGVLVSFLLIGLSLIFLKQAGNYLGWGFQLQSPIIVSMLSILMFVIGIILLTDINIGSSLTRLGRVGSNSINGSFFTGVLAVIVASPCTAPFMGAALGYALIQPSAITIPIFASLGIGFAMPYLILSISPNLIKLLPSPGKWMITLKEFFAFPMFATALWLIWVFSLQTNINLLISLLLSILVISLLFWIILKIKNTRIQTLIWIFIFSTVVFEGAYIQSNSQDISKLSSSEQYSKDRAWNIDIEEDFKRNNQAYLINFTAAWCITCQANDKIALSRPKVKQYMKENNIEYIVADWTNKNDEILMALEKYNRNGVPLYIYWKPGMKEAKLLPAILTEKLILDILKIS